MEEDNSDKVETEDSSYIVHLPSGRSLYDAQSKETRNFIRPQGQKSFLDVGSWLEEKQIESLCQERHELLSEVRAQKPSELAVAEWDPDRKVVILVQNKRHILECMGKMHGDETTLHRLEALFLLDSCQLQLLRSGLPLSVEEAYELLLEDEDDLERYQVYAHLIRGGYTVVLHQGRVNISSYEKMIGLDRYKMQKSRVDVSRSDSDSDIVCLDDEELVKREENQEHEAEESSDSDIEILDVIPAKQPKLQLSESDESVNSVEERQTGAQSVDDDRPDPPSTSQNRTEDTDVVFLSSSPPKRRPCPKLCDGETIGDCVVIELNKKPTRFLDFPKFDGRSVTLKRPPPHLLPRTVEPSKDDYVLDVDVMQRECREKSFHGRTHNNATTTAGNNVSSWRQSCHREQTRGRWRGQWTNEHTMYGESSYRREHSVENSWGTGQSSWHHGHDWRNRGWGHPGRGWCRGADSGREGNWYRHMERVSDWHREPPGRWQQEEEWWRQGARDFHPRESRDQSHHRHAPAHSHTPAEGHAPHQSSSNWSHDNRRWSSPSTSRSRSGGASTEEDVYISVIPKVDSAVSTWAELKAEASRRLNVSTLASGEGAVLWRGKVKPLVMPSNDLSIIGIMSQLAVTKEVDLVHGRNETTTEPKTDLKIDFDVYVPGCIFRKTDPTLPEHRVVYRRIGDGPPTLSDIAALQRPLADDVPLVFAAMDGGSCFLYSIDSVSVPNFAPKT